MLTIQIGEEKDHIHQWAACGDHRVMEYTADAALSLARVLVAYGYDPDEPLEVRRGSMLCLTYSSLGVAAGMMVEERRDGKAPPRFVRYKPSPYGGNAKDAPNGLGGSQGLPEPENRSTDGPPHA